MSTPTIFERIIAREIPAKIVYEDEWVLAFHDVHPQAPVHVLLVPKKPIPSLDHLTALDAPVVAHLTLAIKKIAETLQLENGYRVVVNCGRDGGQTVDHLHYHILGGRGLAWPPG